MTDTPILLSTKQVAARLPFSERTLRAKCKAGTVKFTPLDGRYYFTPEQAERIATDHAVDATNASGKAQREEDELAEALAAFTHQPRRRRSARPAA